MFKDLSDKQKKKIIRIAAAVLLVIISKIFEESIPTLSIVLFLAAYLIVGYDILFKAWKNIIKGNPLDENFLMAFASLGVIILGLTGYSEIDDGCYVMILYQIGELFESIAIGKSRKNISKLIDIRPDYASIQLEDGSFEHRSPDEIPVGTIIAVLPGEKVPIDGVIVEGSSAIDTSALTGESATKDVAAGSEILSGCINLTGLLKVRTTREFGESTASKILDLVENASSRKSKSEDFITKFARIYTPAVCIAAVAIAVLVPVFSMLLGFDAQWKHWIYIAFTFLVISCPCALVISIPLSFFGGLGGASRAGILIKGSNFMEPLSKTSCIVFDKTGTMTKGVFEVCGVHHCPIEDEKLIEYAALAECYSSHPISLSLQRAYGKALDCTRVSDVHEISGQGVTAIVDGKEIACGNSKLMEHVGITHIRCRSVGTVVHVAINGIYSGHILIADQVKPNAFEAIERLKKCGVKKSVMLTGDIESTAKHVASQLGITNVYSELMPSDKVAIVEKLIEEKKPSEALAFVGDGINDAPVLSRSDVGIAMGGIGSDAAIEAADVVIMDDDLFKLSKAVKIAKKCMRIVYENIWFAIGVKLICMIVTVFFFQSMKLAEFADVGVLIIAVLNAIRAMDTRRL